MGLADEAAALRTGRGTRCTAGRLLEELDHDQPDLATELRTLLAGTLEGTAIGKALRARGYAIKDEAIHRHRRGVCACL